MRYRKNSNKMNDMQYRHAFETFCFLSKRHNGKQLTQPIIYDLAAEAIKERSFEASPEEFISDIIKITCLIVKDGEENRFVHKSIQEFFAASYIQRRPDVVARGIYKKLFAAKLGWRFNQELLFLSEIDRYRYFKFGELEFLKEFFEIEESGFRKSPPVQCFAKVRKLLGEISVSVCQIDKYLRLESVQLPYFGPIFWKVQQVYEGTVIEALIKATNIGEAPDEIKASFRASVNVKRHMFDLEDWPKEIEGISGIPSINLALAAKNITDTFFSIALKALNFVEKEENNPAADKLG